MSIALIITGAVAAVALYAYLVFFFYALFLTNLETRCEDCQREKKFAREDGYTYYSDCCYVEHEVPAFFLGVGWPIAFLIIPLFRLIVKAIKHASVMGEAAANKDIMTPRAERKAAKAERKHEAELLEVNRRLEVAKVMEQESLAIQRTAEIQSKTNHLNLTVDDMLSSLESVTNQAPNIPLFNKLGNRK